MIRQDIILADYSDGQVPARIHKYVVDLYKAGVDTKEDIRRQFVMFRNYKIVNGVIYDKDVYFVEKELVDDDKHIVWPITNGAFTGFSDSSHLFNEEFGIEESYDIVTFDDNNDAHIANVPCDVLKIYHPHTQLNPHAIVYADALVGNTKLHVLCKLWDDGEDHSEEDFTIDGVHYSEYMEFLIPDLEWLLGGEAYYEERLSLVKTGLSNGNADDSGLLRTPDNGGCNVQAAFLSLKAYTIPFIIETETTEGGEDLLYKKFITDATDSVAQDYVEFPVRITLAPYTSIDNSIYTNDSNVPMNSDVMMQDVSMSLAGSIGFDNNHIPSFIASFQFPGKDSFSSFREAYEHYYKVDLRDYSGIVEYDEDVDEEDYVEQKQCGFRLNIYSDYKMQAVIAEETFEIDNPETQLSDFSFQLTNTFDSWEQLPDMLIMQARFIDRWLGNIIISNPVAISAESFKYLINNTNESIVKWDGTEETHHIKNDMDLSKINFIDKIVCTVKKESSDSNNVSAGTNGPRVIYKPVFYRVQDLQNIQIRLGLTQNIGIALGDYMTKVESFKMIIGENEIVESARNDIYVIFSVPGSLVAGTNEGNYNIANQDGEYISSGNYTVIS